MRTGYLARRHALLLPLLLAACGGRDDRRSEESFEALRYNYLPPIQLNVSSVALQQAFVPAGGSSDVSGLDPVPPAVALRSMGNDRLLAFGISGRAVFDILDASLIQQSDVITGTMAVSLTIQDDAGARLGYAEARVQGRHTGRVSDLRATLYDMTKSMMTDMNVEFEYQIRQNLKKWVIEAIAPDAPVEQAPLDQPPQ